VLGCAPAGQRAGRLSHRLGDRRGLILQALRERGGIGAAIIAGLGGMAWNVITFLVIPVLVVEDVNPIEGIKRSASLLKGTWGEQIIGNAGIGLLFGLICVAIAVVGIGLGVVVINAGVTSAGVAIIVVTVLAVVVVAMLSATLRGIYSAALYQYAVGGDTGVFTQDALAGAFRPKATRSPFGR
jgi:hypothetical protein